MATVSVRPARTGDACDIGRIQLLTWRIAYSAVVPAHVLKRLTDEEIAASWTEAIASPPSARHQVLVALDSDVPVGFAALGPDDGEPPVTTAGLISTLLVEPRWGRRGHGSRLLAAATDQLRTAGARSAGTWIFRKDPALRRFYESAGWEPDGAARALDMDGRLVDQIRLHVSLVEGEQDG